MQRHAKKSGFATWSDQLLPRLLAVAAGIGWFVALWGVSLPALTAGLAYGGLLLLCVDQFARATLRKREEQMRARIGGELALDALLTQDARRASFRAALWLTRRTDAEMERTTDTGVLCRVEGKRALVLALAIHPSVTVNAQRLAEARREAVRQRAEAAIVCLTAKLCREAEAYAETGEPPIKLIRREELIRLAGACSPATDEQLRDLGARTRRRMSLARLLRIILSPRRARRYLLYGMGLTAMFLLTGLPYYPIPAALCLTMSLLCRLYKPPGKESFWGP